MILWGQLKEKFDVYDFKCIVLYVLYHENIIIFNNKINIIYYITIIQYMTLWGQVKESADVSYISHSLTLLCISSPLNTRRK